MPTIITVKDLSEIVALFRDKANTAQTQAHQSTVLKSKQGEFLAEAATWRQAAGFISMVKIEAGPTAQLRGESVEIDQFIDRAPR